MMEICELNNLSLEFCRASLRGETEGLAAGGFRLVFHILLRDAQRLFGRSSVRLTAGAVMWPKGLAYSCYNGQRVERNSRVSVVCCGSFTVIVNSMHRWATMYGVPVVSTYTPDLYAAVRHFSTELKALKFILPGRLTVLAACTSTATLLASTIELKQ